MFANAAVINYSFGIPVAMSFAGPLITDYATHSLHPKKSQFDGVITFDTVASLCVIELWHK